jgi:hypothetical protein
MCQLQGESLLHKAAAAVGLASDKAQQAKDAATDAATTTADDTVRLSHSHLGLGRCGPTHRPTPYWRSPAWDLAAADHHCLTRACKSNWHRIT